MAIAHKKQGTVGKDGEVNGGAFAKLIVIEVAAVGTEITGAKGLMTGRRDSDATEHGLEVYGVIGQVGAWVFEPGHAFLMIQHPFGVEVLFVFGILHITRSQSGRNDLITGPGRIAVEANALQLHDQGITGNGAVDEEGAGLGIATEREVLSFAIDAAGV